MTNENKKDQKETSETQACSFKVIFEFTGKQKPERATLSIPEGLTKPQQRSFDLNNAASREKCLLEIMADVHLILRETFQWNEEKLSEFEENYQW